MKYGITFGIRNLYTNQNRLITPAFIFWFGTVAYVLLVRSAIRWFSVTKFDMTKSYQPLHYGKWGFFLGAETSSEYPVYTDRE